MTSLVVHFLLFCVLSAAIVLMGSFYTEPEDGPAFRAMPRRYLVFLMSCLAVTAVMIACEYLFAWV